MNKPKLELVSLRKEYDNGSVIAVEDIDLRVEAGETVALLGSSGCGKSTTLNMIVGLESPTSGDIQIDGKSVVAVPPGRRNVGLVFQDYAVFTSMTVRKNLAFGLEVRGKYVLEINRAVEEVAELLGMSDKLEARARDLGGSELQRVAIGRTLVTKPSILLLDEPLSNLETSARLAMRRELRRLQSEIGLTIIYVTHDQVEALSLADRIAVMNAGRILQVEKTAVICANPGHTLVAGFLGSPPMNLVRGRFESEGGEIRFTKGAFSMGMGQGASVPGGYFTMGLRAESIRLVPREEAMLSGRVSLLEPRGPEAVLTVDVGLEKLKVIVPSDARLIEGEEVGLAVDHESLHFFDGDSNRTTSLELAGRVF
jgi:multiple sugar transport system ATP-binding protein